MSDVENFLRMLQADRAEHAPDLSRLSGALPGLRARYRRRTRLATAGVSVAAAVLAVLIAVPLVGHRGAPVQGGSAPVPVGDSLTVGYRPTWLPAGLVERERRQAAGGTGDLTTFRAYASAGANIDDFNIEFRTEPYLELWVGHFQVTPPTPSPTEHSTDVNGAPGWIGTPAQGLSDTFIHWRPDPHTEIWVVPYHVNLSQPDLLHLARSVLPDDGSTTSPVRLTWWPPAGLNRPSGIWLYGRSPKEWHVKTGASRLDDHGALGVDVTTGPAGKTPEGASELTVQGHRAYLQTSTPPMSSKDLTVDFGTYTVKVSASVQKEAPVLMSVEDLQNVALGVRVSPHPDTAWIGTR